MEQFMLLAVVSWNEPRMSSRFPAHPVRFTIFHYEKLPSKRDQIDLAPSAFPGCHECLIQIDGMLSSLCINPGHRWQQDPHRIKQWAASFSRRSAINSLGERISSCLI
jgi:hypothetical protein